MGDLRCLAVKDGKLIWSKSFPKDYRARAPLWGFAAHPLVDGNKLICLVGGKGSVVVAFDKDTGKELWKSLSMDSSEIGYCPPMIYTVGGKRQLIVWHPEAVNGLDPETGKPLWAEEFTVRASLTIPTPRLAGDRLFVTAFYDGCRLFQVSGGDSPGAKLLWRSRGRGERPGQTDKLHAIMCTPFIKEGHVYGVCSYGELRCLRLSDGKRLWANLEATGYAGGPQQRWANAFLVAQGDRFFLFNEKGDLIIARLSPKGYEQVDKAHLLDPTTPLEDDRKVLWSHPAFADKCIFARNDKEVVCVSLAGG
jgi:hypothetical protein